jgi:hypothetical protein
MPGNLAAAAKPFLLRSGQAHLVSSPNCLLSPPEFVLFSFVDATNSRRDRMRSQRFDYLTNTLGTRLSRRSALVAGAGLTLASSQQRFATAQDATPAASPLAEGGEKPEMLFVQTFERGSLAPKDGEEGIFVLTLHGANGRTIGFSDRPERIVGSVPTQTFLDGLGFSPVDPPNAALVFEPSPGETDIVVLELLDPQYDEDAGTLTYEVRILDTFAGTGLTFQEEPRAPNPAGEEFTDASLFIDDCSDLGGCYPLGSLNAVGPIPGGPYGQCWSWGGSGCQPDNSPCNNPDVAHLEQMCDDAYPDDCDGDCQLGV